MPSSRSDAPSIASGVIAALRNRAASIRKRAADGVTVLDRHPVVVIKTSESAHAYHVAKDWDEIANTLEEETA